MTLLEQIAALNARIDDVVRWQDRHDKLHAKVAPPTHSRAHSHSEVTPVGTDVYHQLNAEATMDIVERAVGAEQRRKPIMLVVDDSADWQALYKLKFEHTTTLLLATSYLEAVALLNKHLPTLVILDIVFVGTQHSGIDVLRHLRRQVAGGALVHVMIVSGLGDDLLTQRTIKESNDNGPIEFVEKYKVLNHLDSALHQYLDKS